MSFFDQPALLEQDEIAADGHVGHAQRVHEICYSNRALIPDATKDVLLPLPCERWTTSRPELIRTGFGSVSE
jgi:hypothetical protein